MRPNVLIGVQARSTSTRLRGKCDMAIGETTMVGHVMQQAIRAAAWLSQDMHCDVVMLIPEGDDVMLRYKGQYLIHEGPEQDVLTRFVSAATEYDSDIIVRLTGDCAWMTSYMIAKCVRAYIKYEADYCSNVLVRTFMEGLDVEVISRQLLLHLNHEAVTPEDREHVTSAIPGLVDDDRLGGFKLHTVMSDFDFSHIKTSVDTAEEYEACNFLYQQKRKKRERAKSLGTYST